MTYSSQSGQGAISNILAIAGFIILIAIIVWGSFHFFNIASSGFSSFFGSSSADEITLTLSGKEVNSGQPLDVSWNYDTEGTGSFAFLYQCRDGFQFRSVNASGIVNAVPCGSSFPIGNETLKTVRLIPALTGTAAVDVTVTVVFNPTAATSTSTASSRPQGTATVKVNPQTVAAAPTPVVKTPTPTQAPSAPAGRPDLVVRVISVGVIDSYSGAFVNRMPTSQYDVVAVKFDIANQGTGASGGYYFTAQLPTAPASPYASPLQASLAPGSHIENTLRFNNVTTGGALFSVSADPSNAVGETNESNNSASQWVSGGYGSYPTPQYPYVY